MSGKRGLVDSLEGAWQDLTVTLKHFFGKTKILTVEYNLEKNITTQDLSFQCSAQQLVISPKCEVKSSARMIISPQAITIHWSKLTFEQYDLPIKMTSKVEKVFLNLSMPAIEKSILVEKRNLVQQVEIARCSASVFFLALGLQKKKIFNNLALVLNKPLQAKKINFQQLEPQTIIAYWQLLLKHAQLSKENMEFIGVYQPIPLHKVSQIKYNSVDSSISLFLQQIEKKKPVRLVKLLVGRDKIKDKIFTVILPLENLS